MRHRKTITLAKTREQIIEEALARDTAVRVRRQQLDERDLLLEAPPLPKYVEEKKRKMTLTEIIMFPKQFLP